MVFIIKYCITVFYEIQFFFKEINTPNKTTGIFEQFQ